MPQPGPEKCKMELAVAPPPRVAAGVSFHTPLVVTFSGSSTAASEDDQQKLGEPFTLPDLSGVWTFLSLTTADTREDLAPPRKDLFCGTNVDSVHPVYYEQEVDRPTIAYATFPGLVINEPGRYRIKISIIDMNAYALVILQFIVKVLIYVRAFRGDGEHDAGKVLPCLYSQVFDVVEASEHSGCGMLQIRARIWIT